MPGSDSATRLHFIHVQSPYANAVPLLLIPPFPFTNLSLSHLIPLFTDPEDAGKNQPFHLVIPSLPGLGFSDALPNNLPMIETTADMFDTLMKRLDYPHYIASNTSPSSVSPSQIDWKLANYLALNFSKSCLGFHFISPPLRSPKVRQAPWEWTKWKLSSVLDFGYTNDDLSAWKRSRTAAVSKETLERDTDFSFSMAGFHEPNTMSYALCDSPVGLLLFMLMVLRVLGQEKELTSQQLITLTELTWLPGPEAMMRFWAHCASTAVKEGKKPPRKPKISITVFTGDNKKTDSDRSRNLTVSPRPVVQPYACPSWGKGKYDIVKVQRVAGKPGLLAWERPDVIVDGVRGLAKAILAVDKRMQKAEQPGATLLEQVVVDSDDQAPADISGTTIHGSVESPSEATKKAHAHVKGSDHLQVPGQDIESSRSSPEMAELRESSNLLDTVVPEEDENSSPDTVVPAPSKLDAKSP